MTWLMEILKTCLGEQLKEQDNKAFNIAKNRKYYGYQRGFSSMISGK